MSIRKQRTKINASYSSWEEILFEVPHRPILGPLLFNIFICDLFIMIDDFNIANYADDNTPFVSGDIPLNVITSLENAAEKLFEWFTNNHMKANHEKCHLLMSTFTPISIKVKDYIIKNSDYEKLLGLTVDASSQEVLKLKKNFQGNKAVIDKTPFFVLSPFCASHSIILNTGF